MKMIVNGTEITADAFKNRISQIKQQQPEIKDEEALDRAKHDLADWAIIRIAANGANLTPDPSNVEKEFAQLMQSHGGKEAFFKRFKLTEADEKRVRDDVEQNMLVQLFFDTLTVSAELPSHAEAERFYDEHLMEYIKPATIHAAHIVKQPKGAEQAEIAFQELSTARQELLDGADFITLANEIVDSENVKPDLGTFARGSKPPEFECVAFSMNEGEVSPVITTQFGLQLIKVFKKNEEQQATFTECADAIKARLLSDRKNVIVSKWVETQRTKATIEIVEDSDV